MTVKYCYACDSDRPIEMFYKRHRVSSAGTYYAYHEARCRDCLNAANRKRYQNRPRIMPTKDRYPQELLKAKGWGWNPNRGPMLILEEAKNAWNKH